MQVKLKPCNGPDCEGKLRSIWKREGKLLYCASCWNKIKPTVPVKASKALPRSQKPIPKRSEKRKKEDVLYSAMRKVFLEHNPTCQLNVQGICVKTATDIQHCKGRGKYYLDTRFWKSGCRPCHSYADTHPQEAIENGWAVLRLTEE